MRGPKLGFVALLLNAVLLTAFSCREPFQDLFPPGASAAEDPLAGTDWTLSAFQELDMLIPSVSGVGVTLSFGSDGVMEQEARLLDWLKVAERFRLEGDRLRLTHEEGERRSCSTVAEFGNSASTRLGRS